MMVGVGFRAGEEVRYDNGELVQRNWVFVRRVKSEM